MKETKKNKNVFLFFAQFFEIDSSYVALIFQSSSLTYPSSGMHQYLQTYLENILFDKVTESMKIWIYYM